MLNSLNELEKLSEESGSMSMFHFLTSLYIVVRHTVNVDVLSLSNFLRECLRGDILTIKYKSLFVHGYPKTGYWRKNLMLTKEI